MTKCSSGVGAGADLKTVVGVLLDNSVFQGALQSPWRSALAVTQPVVTPPYPPAACTEAYVSLLWGRGEHACSLVVFPQDDTLLLLKLKGKQLHGFSPDHGVGY